MEFLTMLLEVIKTLEVILTWKILSVCLFVSNVLLLRRYSGAFNAILSGMDNYIKFSCVMFSVLCAYKILASLLLYCVNSRKEQSRKAELRDKILCLSPKEAAILKYIFVRPDKVAWLPRNLGSVRFFV